MTRQQFTLQEVARFKTADLDHVISVGVGQIAELIEQKERLFEQNERLLAKDVQSEEENAEHRSKIADLGQRISDLECSNKSLSFEIVSMLNIVAIIAEESGRVWQWITISFRNCYQL